MQAELLNQHETEIHHNMSFWVVLRNTSSPEVTLLFELRFWKYFNSLDYRYFIEYKCKILKLKS